MITQALRGPRLRTKQWSRIRYLTTLGIRREDPSRVWERRVPLTPDAIQSLLSTKTDLAVEVESCERRCFSNQLYHQAGAKIVDELSGAADVVLGIKEAPVHEVIKLLNKENKKRTWMMFSHTHKGQVYNTPLLSSFLDESQRQTLVDHELLTAPQAGKLKRVAAFGWYAGAVGAGEALCLTGLALLRKGFATPLLHLPRPYTFNSVEEYKAGLKKVGASMKDAPEAGLQPIVIGITGSGNVGTGARDMLEALGVEWIHPDRLSSVTDSTKIYGCVLSPTSYMARLDDDTYTRKDYYANPSEYYSTFTEKIAPYLTGLINGVGWQSGFPRTMTNKDIDNLLCARNGGLRLSAIQDVSCDMKGGLEFVDRHTTVDSPYFEGPGGMLISTTDILPTELPLDASTHFSNCIFPYVERLVSGSKKGDEIDQTLDRSKIVNDGVITSEHSWLAPRVDGWRNTQAGSSRLSSSDIHEVGATQSTLLREKKKKVLLLGSGLVAGPAVDVFVLRGDVELVIASNNLSEATALAKGRDNIQVTSLDVSDQNALKDAVAACDVVVSLLPAPMHPLVARHCIDHGKHLVTASYVSPEMKALDQEAREKGVLLLGECGLDPGIDSMAAMRILDRVRREGKKVSSFVSWCGGLPEPSGSNVPLGYKFSWSPKAVLTAALNPAQYKLNGKLHSIPGDRLLESHFSDVPLWKGLALEGLANRDSLPYAEKYGMGEIGDLKNLFRGTLRYKGFSTLLDSFRKLGLLSSEPIRGIENWDQFLIGSTQAVVGQKVKKGDTSSLLRDILGSRQGETEEALRWLGLLPSTSGSNTTQPQATIRPPPPSLNSPIDLLANLLSQKLAYAPHERDSCLLHHSFELSPDHPGQPSQNVTASLLLNGDEKASAMSVTVGKTLAFAAGRVLDGKVGVRGVTGPYDREVWEGVLDDLESVGVRVNETWS